MPDNSSSQGTAERFEPTNRSRVKRMHNRAAYDKTAVYSVIDATALCHVGYVIDGQPYVTPTVLWRQGDTVFWHGSSASRMLRAVREGIPVCVTVTHFDGLVLGRSPMHHSANYRCAMLFGKARAIVERAAKEEALDAMMEGLYPGRLETLRGNTEQELKATMVVAMEIEDAVAKVRTGPPVDDEEDYENVHAWAGVQPLKVVAEPPIPDPRLRPGIEVPDYLTK